MPITRKTIGSDISEKEKEVYQFPLNKADTELFVECIERAEAAGTMEGYLAKIEDWANRVFEQAGLPLYETGTWCTIGQAKKDERITEKWYAVELVTWIQFLRFILPDKDASEIVPHSLRLGELFREAQMKFEWGEDASTGRKTRITRNENLQSGRDTRSQSARKKWAPWRIRFEDLLIEKDTANAALEALMDEMAKEGTKVPSERTLKIRLSLIVDWPRFRRRYEKRIFEGLTPAQAIDHVRKEIGGEGLKVPSVRAARAKLGLDQET